ncbi:MAG TPA: putative metal-dependent hydrolase [Thermoanaerobaculia bacterium]|nr:putative metal-dependent hydrolase [Thermoanaerobaculia bacterium]
MTDLRYPIGKFERRDELSADERRAMIDTIAAAPERMREAAAGLSEAQLDTPYREGGWTVRQVIHHVPDSHLNAYVRLKLALTEDDPLIRPYDEALWADLPDSEKTPIEVSLTLLESLHARWVTLLRSLNEADFRRTLRHPEHSGVLTVDWLVAMYAWHSRHHVGHVTSLRERMGW